MAPHILPIRAASRHGGRGSPPGRDPAARRARGSLGYAEEPAQDVAVTALLAHPASVGAFRHDGGAHARCV